MAYARELFEEAARATRRLAVVDAELAAIDDAWRSGDWLQPSRSGRRSDSTASRAVYRMGRSKNLGIEKESLEQVIDEAQQLADGIEKLLGWSYAAALKCRYLEGMTWQDVADEIGMCESTARSRLNVSLDLIDGLGPANVREARGVAAV